MLAFAGNSLLCRWALRDTGIEAASFTMIRLISGAAVLALVVRPGATKGDWRSAFALFAYATAFSFAYVQLSAAAGALILFGMVQVTMVTCGWYTGERPAARQLVGLGIAMTGLAVLVLKGANFELGGSIASHLLMAVAGVSWGIYSMRGRNAADAKAVTRGNFVRAAALSIALLPAVDPGTIAHSQGLALAVASGALTSAVGYVLWYSVTPQLRAIQASTVQLSVPLITAIAGILLLGETLAAQQIIGGLMILGGTALTMKRS